MEKVDNKYAAYVRILREELVPAIGCTEPIAIAYGAAKARAELGCLPDTIHIEVSGNIMKNAKSAVVPNTNGLKGIAAAAAAGIIAGKEKKVLEVIADVTENEKDRIQDYLARQRFNIQCLDSNCVFEIILTLSHDQDYVKLRMVDYHTNITSIEKNGHIVYERLSNEKGEERLTDKSVLNVKDILEFAESVNLNDIEDLISQQIQYNTAIAAEGLKGDYGANVGRVLLSTYGNDVKVRAKAKAAAGSDARMGGCELPVIIVSGSGNQGITASVPVIEYARELHSEKEKLYRALVLSNLITIHQKTGIGRLSAFCGAVSAGCGSGAGIAYLLGGGYEEIAHTIVNALAIVSGIVCDGAKSSCAAKIATAVDAGLMGYYMYKSGQQFRGGDGIISKGVENTISNIRRLGKEGMKETDKEILKIMMNSSSSVV